MIGWAIARRTSGGTGVGPGASKYFFNMMPLYRGLGKKKPEPRLLRGPGVRLLKVRTPSWCSTQKRQSCVPTIVFESRAATVTKARESVKVTRPRGGHR